MNKLATRQLKPFVTPSYIGGDEVVTFAETVFNNSYERVKWFNTPNKGLNNKKPIDLLESLEGCILVKNSLIKINYGHFG